MIWVNSILREEADGDPGGGGSGDGTGVIEKKPEGSSASLLGGNDVNTDPKGEPAANQGHDKGTGDDGGSDFKPFSIYDEGKVSDKFLSTLSEEDKGLKKFFEKYATSEDPNKAVLQGIKNLQYLAGQKALEPLSDDAPDGVKEERRQLMAKLNNVPDKPEGYGIKAPEKIPEGVIWPEGSEAKYSEVFHKHNASPDLVKELMDIHNQGLDIASKSVEQQISHQREEEIKSLRTEYGDRTNEILKNAMRGGMALGLEKEQVQALSTSALAVKAFARVTELLSEDKLPSGDGTGNAHGQNYREQAIDIMSNENNPLYKAYHDANHPQHEDAVRRRSELNARWHNTKKK